MKVDKIRQIVKLKRVMQRWKDKSLRRRSADSDSDSDASGSGSRRRVQSGFLAVYVGPERRRFVIPTRFLRLHVFVGLLNKAEEEFGFPGNGGLVLPCDAAFFQEVLRLLERDEGRFGRLGLEGFLKLVSEVGFDSSCKEEVSSSSQAFTPLLRKARV